MLIDEKEVNLFTFRNCLGEPLNDLPIGITLDNLLTAFEETDDSRLIASFARHIAEQEDCVSLGPLVAKYRDSLPLYAKKALWRAIAMSVRNEEPPVELIEKTLNQQNLPFDLLLNIYRTCSDSMLSNMALEENDPRREKAIDMVYKERFEI